MRVERVAAVDAATRADIPGAKRVATVSRTQTHALRGRVVFNSIMNQPRIRVQLLKLGA